MKNRTYYPKKLYIFQLQVQLRTGAISKKNIMLLGGLV